MLLKYCINIFFGLHIHDMDLCVVFVFGVGYRNNGTAENSTLCKATLFFPDKFQNFTNDKMFIRKTESDYGKCIEQTSEHFCSALKVMMINQMRRFLLNFKCDSSQIVY